MDHIASVSTLHRCHVFYKTTPRIWTALCVLGGASFVTGAVLRGFRCSCRFGTCANDPSGDAPTGPFVWDGAIAANVLVTEAILLAALLYKCLEFQRGSETLSLLSSSFSVRNASMSMQPVQPVQPAASTPTDGADVHTKPPSAVPNKSALSPPTFNCTQSLAPSRPASQHQSGFGSGNSLYEEFIRESWIRLSVCVPLGVLECISYINTNNKAGPRWWGAFTFVGVCARQLCCSLIIASILSAKERRRVGQSLSSSTSSPV